MPAATVVDRAASSEELGFALANTFAEPSSRRSAISRLGPGSTVSAWSVIVPAPVVNENISASEFVVMTPD